MYVGSLLSGAYFFLCFALFHFYIYFTVSVGPVCVTVCACEFLVLWSRANCIVILQVLMRILAPELADDFASYMLTLSACIVIKMNRPAAEERRTKTKAQQQQQQRERMCGRTHKTQRTFDCFVAFASATQKATKKSFLFNNKIE